MHTLLLPYFSEIIFKASREEVNRTDPFRVSHVKKRKSSSISRLIVGPLRRVPLRAKTALGAPLGRISTKSDSAADRSHSSIAPNMEPSLWSMSVSTSLYLNGVHHLGARASIWSVLCSCLSSSSK
ncbi:hypothetical protein MIMGU_mgv1a016334mg [Erythranthe guttata]|uniref:Uncharacterized protein n=1 Tax=Erythranthe guttata TaxID=4155 RepID=A0A022R192_ERYGU|nr:hypothetical protein MIMGU_mgv1a016334mg [Erythranthe guttata]